jgi:hypothetical protein
LVFSASGLNCARDLLRTLCRVNLYYIASSETILDLNVFQLYAAETPGSGFLERAVRSQSVFKGALGGWSALSVAVRRDVVFRIDDECCHLLLPLCRLLRS